jgi:hypothetical protein
LAPIGSGKSHLLKNITTDKKILRLDDTDNIKKSLAQIYFIFSKKRNRSGDALEGFYHR